MCDFHKERVVRSAKKEHECYLCGQKIEKGEQYRILTGVFCGDFYNLKLHGQCHCMVEAYWAEQEYNDEGWDDTMVKPELLAQMNITPDRVYCILEDRDSMVAKWRELGYRCLQVAEGKF